MCRVGELMMVSVAASCVFVVMPVTDRASRPGQSQRGSDLHRHRPSPVYHSELWHYRRHVQRLFDRERNARPAHGPEGSVLQAGYHGSTNQLTARGNSSQLARQPTETNVKSSVIAVHRERPRLKVCHNMKTGRYTYSLLQYLLWVRILLWREGSCDSHALFWGILR